MLYCMMMKKVFNLGAIIQSTSSLGWKFPKVACHSPQQLRSCVCTSSLPWRASHKKINLGDICNQTTLKILITLHQNKEEDRCLKTLSQIKDLEGDGDDDELPSVLPLKRMDASTSKQPTKKP